MEQLLFIVSMSALGLCFCVFILGIFNHGLRNLFESKYTKVSALLFVIYILTFIPYLIISSI